MKIAKSLGEFESPLQEEIPPWVLEAVQFGYWITDLNQTWQKDPNLKKRRVFVFVSSPTQSILSGFILLGSIIRNQIYLSHQGTNTSQRLIVRHFIRLWEAGRDRTLKCGKKNGYKIARLQVPSNMESSETYFRDKPNSANELFDSLKNKPAGNTNTLENGFRIDLERKSMFLYTPVSASGKYRLNDLDHSIQLELLDSFEELALSNVKPSSCERSELFLSGGSKDQWESYRLYADSGKFMTIWDLMNLDPDGAAHGSAFGRDACWFPSNYIKSKAKIKLAGINKRGFNGVAIYDEPLSWSILHAVNNKTSLNVWNFNVIMDSSFSLCTV